MIVEDWPSFIIVGSPEITTVSFTTTSAHVLPPKKGDYIATDVYRGQFIAGIWVIATDLKVSSIDGPSFVVDLSDYSVVEFGGVTVPQLKPNANDQTDRGALLLAALFGAVTSNIVSGGK